MRWSNSYPRKTVVLIPNIQSVGLVPSNTLVGHIPT